jgi:hypothetical protein
MKVKAKPISVISATDTKGAITPLRFKMQQEDESFITIKVDKILTRDREKLAGNHMYIFRCKSVIDDVEKVYELKYEISTCKWMLWKI